MNAEGYNRITSALESEGLDCQVDPMVTGEAGNESEEFVSIRLKDPESQSPARIYRALSRAGLLAESNSEPYGYRDAVVRQPSEPELNQVESPGDWLTFRDQNYRDSDSGLRDNQTGSIYGY